MNRTDIVALFELGSPSLGLFPPLEDINNTEEWKIEEQLRCQKFQKFPGVPIRVNNSLKQQMRFGIPCTHRRKLWLLASGGMKLLLENGDVWDNVKEVAAQSQMSPLNVFGVVPAVFDLFPKAVQTELHEFLHAVWVQNRDIHFSPLIPVVSSLLFLFMESRLAYASIQAMINRSRTDHWYFPLTQERFMASAHGMGRLIESKSADLACHAKKLGLSIGELMLTIFPTFFLPFTTLQVTLTIFDSFVSEGRKVLTRLCIVFMLNCKTRLLKAQTSIEFLRVLIESIEGLNSVEAIKALLKRSFKLTLSRHRHISPAECTASRRGQMGGPVRALSEQFCLRRRSLTLCSNMASEIHHELMPDVIGGTLLTRQLFLKLRESMPSYYQRFSAVSVFQTSEHGIALSSLFARCVPSQPHILIIQTEHAIVGAVLSDPPVQPDQGIYFGSGVTFVFRGEEVFHKSPPANNRYITVSGDSIAVGGPEAAIFISDGMKMLVSQDCPTFGSPRLVNGQVGDLIIEVELYVLQLRSNVSKTRRREEIMSRDYSQ